jgi:dihydropyrimidinase
MFDLVVKNGKLVYPGGIICADIAVSGERISAIGTGLEGKQEHDARGMFVLPGIIDAHTHMLLKVGKYTSSDDFYTGTRAAAMGGVTTIIDFSLGSPERTIAEDISLRLKEAEPSVVDYSFHSEVLGWEPGQEEQFRQAIDMGVTSFKFYTSYAATGRRSESDTLYHAFRAIAETGAVAIVHAEDEHLIDSIVSTMGPDRISRMASLAEARPSICEGSAVDQVVFFAEQTGARAHIVHVSSALGAERIRLGQERGVRITGETCPQYLLLTKDVYKGEEGHLFSASPALRTEVDQEALWKALAERVISSVVTDHCPFTREQKTWKGSFMDLPYGMPGVETLLPLVYSEGVCMDRISMPDLSFLLSEQTARIFNLYPRKGSLSIGSDADLVIFDPEAEWTICADTLHMNVDFSPYEGKRVRGKVLKTFSRGELIADSGEFAGEKGRGRFLRRSL